MNIAPRAAAEVDLRATVVMLAVLALPLSIAAAIDPRTVGGAAVWAKPLRFLLSFALHWATVLVLLRCAASAVRASRTMSIALVTGASATVIEVAVIVVQAARGRASHFNADTPLDALLYYGVMGPAAVVIVLATAVVGASMLRSPDVGVGPGLARGAGLGLLLSGLATLVVASPLAAGAPGSPPHLDPALLQTHRLPLAGWSTAQGDLRVPHFLATHLAQALPLAGWIADRVAPSRARAGVHAAAVLGVAVVAATFVLALAGRPFIGAR